MSLQDSMDISSLSMDELKKAGIMPGDLIPVYALIKLDLPGGAAGQVYAHLKIDLSLQEGEYVPQIEGVAFNQIMEDPASSVLGSIDGYIAAGVVVADDELDENATFLAFESEQLDEMASDTIELHEPGKGAKEIASWWMMRDNSENTTEDAQTFFRDDNSPKMIPTTIVKDKAIHLHAGFRRSNVTAGAINFWMTVTIWVRYVPITLDQRVKNLENEIYKS